MHMNAYTHSLSLTHTHTQDLQEQQESLDRLSAKVQSLEEEVGNSELKQEVCVCVRVFIHVFVPSCVGIPSIMSAIPSLTST